MSLAEESQRFAEHQKYISKRACRLLRKMILKRFPQLKEGDVHVRMDQKKKA